MRNSWFNGIKNLFSHKNEAKIPQWVADAYAKRDKKIEELRVKYLEKISSFNFDSYSSFSQMCINFRHTFDGEMGFDDLSYCEYKLKLSPLIKKFKVKRLEGESKEYKRIWEEGISQEYFYDPPLQIGDVILRPGLRVDNTSLFDCFQIVKKCDKCRSIVTKGDRCYGLATIGHFLIFGNDICLNCPIENKKYQDKLTEMAIERFNG